MELIIYKATQVRSFFRWLIVAMMNHIAKKATSEIHMTRFPEIYSFRSVIKFGLAFTLITDDRIIIASKSRYRLIERKVEK